MVPRVVWGVIVGVAIWVAGPSASFAHDEAWEDRWDTASDVEAPPDLAGLAAYGDWVSEPPYGRVWRPRVDADWRPYWRGHWSRRGEWVWVSADPWGNAPFHYGEWIWSVRFGWVWIPGTVWAPARVTWIVDGPVIAWAPASVHITIGPDPRFWVYADFEHFKRPIVRPHRRPPPHRHVHRGGVIRDLDRVVAPHRPPTRTFRSDPSRERTYTVSTERRVSAPREDRPNRRFNFESSRESSRGAGGGRGFERRDAR
jgi:hypothetical protein